MYPQYQLYLFTEKLNSKKRSLIPENCDSRCVDSTIINRAYYSSYLYSLEWLEDQHDFKLKRSFEFIANEQVISEHKQVITALKKYDLKCGNRLSEIKKLRNISDYKPYEDISAKEVEVSVGYMEYIFNNLKF